MKGRENLKENMQKRDEITFIESTWNGLMLMPVLFFFLMVSMMPLTMSSVT
jgi:hypothetical protein